MANHVEITRLFQDKYSGNDEYVYLNDVDKLKLGDHVKYTTLAMESPRYGGVVVKLDKENSMIYLKNIASGYVYKLLRYNWLVFYKSNNPFINKFEKFINSLCD